MAVKPPISAYASGFFSCIIAVARCRTGSLQREAVFKLQSPVEQCVGDGGVGAHTSHP